MENIKKTKPGPVKSVGLTKAQEDTFSVICRLKEQHGVAPSLREIAAERGVSAVSALEIIQQAAEQKRADKGGFDNRIYNAFVEIEAGNPSLGYYRARPDQYPEVK